MRYFHQVIGKFTIVVNSQSNAFSFPAPLYGLQIACAFPISVIARTHSVFPHFQLSVSFFIHEVSFPMTYSPCSFYSLFSFHSHFQSLPLPLHLQISFFTPLYLSLCRLFNFSFSLPSHLELHCQTQPETDYFLWL